MMTLGTTLTRRTLASLELFRGLLPAAQQDVVASARAQRFVRNARIFNQGDSNPRAHVLLDGNVRISQSGSDGAQIVMRLIAPGEMFGTVALFTDHRYPADAEAMTDAFEASWSEGDLLKLMQRHPQIATNALKIVGKRLQEAQDRMRELSTQRVEQRVAHALVRLIRQAGRETDDGTAIAFPLRRKDIADICGTTLYSVSRIFTAWEKTGWLITRDQQLIVRKPSEIRRIGEDTRGPGRGNGIA
jgi:CRP-like cAMP-binding protein